MLLLELCFKASVSIDGWTFLCYSSPAAVEVSGYNAIKI
jgi:hypothetical protein